ncbi:MAG: PAS domain-containing protein [Bacteriovorax sp.]|jgi:PAS domain S-box-containing protein
MNQTNVNNNIDYKLLFESTPAPYLILDISFKIIAVNNAYLLATKTERDKILYRSLFDIFPDDPKDPEATGVLNLMKSLERVREHLEPDIMSIQKYNIPNPETPNGPYLERFWRPSNYPVFNHEGDLLYIIHYVEDITSFMQMKNRASTTEIDNLQLKDIRIFLESILENLPNMVFVKDAKDLRYVKFNKAGEELLGYTQEELVGKNDYDFFPKEQADFFTSKDRAVLESGRILDIPEEPILTRLNGDRILHTKKVPLYDENKKPLYLIGISEDITDKIDLIEARLSKEATEEMAKRKIQFLDIAAHELRTPVTSLTLFLQLALKQAKKGTPLTIDVLTKIYEPAFRLKRLVIDLLDMSRLERGLLTLMLAETDIISLVSTCVADFKLQFPERTFIFDKPDNAIMIEIDSVRINQVLSNLLDNAVKYTQENPITISLEEFPETVKVSVKDRGAGIPKDQLQFLFLPFSRGSSDATIRASGLGLGLSVSHGIVNLHGGVMGVLSEPGQGSLFYFDLPKKKQH